MTATLDQLGKTSDKTRIATTRVLTALAANGKSISQVFGNGPSGEHATGYATDFMVYSDKTLGDWIANWIWSNRNTLGVAYIMWHHCIISTNPNGKYGPAGQWNWVEDRGNPTQNHMDHVHVTWTTTMPNAQLSKPIGPAMSGENMSLTTADAKVLWRSDIIPAPGKPSTGNTEWQPDSYLRLTYEAVARIEAQNRALVAAVASLSMSQGLDPSTVQKTLDAAVKDALSGLSITLTT